MAYAKQFFTFVLVCTTIGGTLGGSSCPVQKYVQKHVCEDCWTREKAITFAKASNQHRSGKACLVHVFDGSTDAKKYKNEKGQCVLREPVGGWMCNNVLSSDATDCVPVKNCLPAHDDRTEKEGRMYSPGINCKPVLPLKASKEVEKCSRACHAATSTSRALCRVSSAVASSSLCLSDGWFTLGFPCLGAIGEASTLSEGCTSVIDSASDSCDGLCWSVVTRNITSSSTDYNKLLNDHICLFKETPENHRWLDAVRFQGRVVDKQKEILDKMDAMKDINLEREIQNRLKAGSELLTEIRQHRQRYNRIMYSKEGLLVVNSYSDYFKHKALQDGRLHSSLKDLYQHLSGYRIPSIYQKQRSFCTQQIFSRMNSYLVEGYLMLSIALELGDKEGSLPDITDNLDSHQKEFIKQCGCPPAGSAPYVVQASIQPLIYSIENMVDIFSSSDILLTVLPFVKTNGFKDISIIMRALSGAIQESAGDKSAVIKKLNLLKSEIEEKSLKVCPDFTPTPTPTPTTTPTSTPTPTTTPTSTPTPTTTPTSTPTPTTTPTSTSTPTTTPTSTPTPTTTPVVTTCGRLSHCKMYKGNCWCHHKYSDHEQREACGYESGYSDTYYSIVSSGTPRDLILAMGLTPRSDCSNSDCEPDCATNMCYDFGCCGTSLTCWNDQLRWGRKHQGIVRCRNYES